ncbi:hypothetical protein [Methanoplanus endosymbiosus]|uniref:Uncharacterized protein n=1 Tax=Methanoplanus endosymbiosus TaxID=33865 RepID=A0A9E7PMF1_9EURY|nr:hypothetical protein [Methanoplanus endosymbiosus]UUX92900.1 hypothetical protein L6E24_01860 [Methanoplanus endosymbiosus]
MREEEQDWIIYRIICSVKKITFSELKTASGFEDEQIKDSIQRLENNCLTSVHDSEIRIMSVNEMLLKNQIKNTIRDDKSPVIFENGVIKANPDYRR